MARREPEGLRELPRPTVQEILDRERNPVPEALRERAFEELGAEDIAAARYFDRAFFAREMASMWTRTWQMACREEEIPEAGDHVLYEIGPYGLIVMRTPSGRIRAYHNACLHRGRALRTEGGRVAVLRCPFHGFTWDLEGALAELPCAWDFPQVRREAMQLPEARVGTWGGFVFVNLADAGPSLETYLGDLPAHFARWELESRSKAVHVGKVIEANWKVCCEAFIESLHVKATHPQIMASTGDINTQYDVSSANPHVNRMITPMAVPSPYLGADFPEQRIVDEMTGRGTRGRPEGERVELPPGTTARQFMAERTRQMLAGMSGRDFSKATDSEMLDAIEYFVFPNFCPWGGFGMNIIYRFRPVGMEPEQTLMEVMLLFPTPAQGPRPKPAALHLLGPDERWTEAAELGPLGPIFEQDMRNLPHVQKGLHRLRKGVTLARYQESRIRQLHHTLDRYLASDLGDLGGAAPARGA